MSMDALIGMIAIIAALGFIAGLFFWSSRRIDRIAESKERSLVEILKGL